MKKIYTVVAAALICGNLSAQIDSLDFESFVLAPESFDNGAAGTGDFYTNSVVLSNYYDVAWGSWNGFAISNVTDNTAPGWGNQYSAFPGSGRNSSNYGVFYPDGTIQGTFGNTIIDSFYITNTSFSAISMRDGDAFGKQFGSIFAADGVTVDGTNGEDFFKVWIIVEDYFSSQKDSVEVYLADYRFTDNSQDYIVDTWIKVDLSSFIFWGSKLSFRFESSDMGAFGINTPTYFAIDDIYVSFGEGVNENQSLQMEVYPNPLSDYLVVKAENGALTLRDINGKIVLEETHNMTSTLNTSNLPSGVYFLELKNAHGTATKKVFK